MGEQSESNKRKGQARRERLKARVAGFPRRPGVYMFRDRQRKVIYIGKAKSLRDRVSSYLGSMRGVSEKTTVMAEDIADVEYTVCDDEIEALILECNLIKKYHPRFNVFLRDDKSYPYLVVTLNDEFPRAMVVRGKKIRDARYFGPYVNAGALRQTLDLVRRVFPVRHCRGREPGRRDGSPCLYYHLGRCLGPCIGDVELGEYRDMIQDFCAFLQGKHEEILLRIKAEMHEAAEKMEFEEAARKRNQLEAAEQVRMVRRSVVGVGKNRDIVGLARDEIQASFILGQTREGSFLGNIGYFVDVNPDLSNEEVLNKLLTQYYSESETIPPIVTVPFYPSDREVEEEWLSRRRGARVRITLPMRGEGKRLITLAQANARLALEDRKRSFTSDPELLRKALGEIHERLDLDRPPLRIECYDISTMGGTESVGSMVVFQDGLPEPRSYRRFAIRSVSGVDDVGMMREVLTRRFQEYLMEKKKKVPAGKKRKVEGFHRKPDMVLIDGGKPQMAAVVAVLEELGIREVEVAAIAKRLEEIYRPGALGPIMIPRGSTALFLLQRVRDESHRFAITYHKKLRGKRVRSSWLDGVKGVGPKRKRMLIRYFGSPRKVSEASLEQIQSVPGIPEDVAEAVHNAARARRGG